MNPHYPVWYLDRWDGSKVALFWGSWHSFLLALAVSTLLFSGMVALTILYLRRKRRDR